ncbi:MAG: ATP-binding protein [Flavobacterium sp.]|uniref:ATP-binding protein n=1 Tax=Flavobacterium sp. TaxID=239 RepID=UPI00260E85DF|nr:ATP-binding protein [Flavobacterium sp.]MDD5148990.1 ATP-binding protein [Flavobacterium sp.]
MKIQHKIKIFFGSLRGRLILSVAIVHAVMMSVFIIDLTQRQCEMILDHQTEEAQGLAQALSTTSSSWLTSNDIAGLQELVNSQRRYPQLVFAIITNEQGKILAHTDESKEGLFLLDLPQNFKTIVLSKTPDLVDVAVPVNLYNKNVGWVRIGLNQNKVANQLKNITNNGVVYGLLAILIGSVIAWFVGHYITRRLHSVQKTINEVADGKTSARSHLTGNDEAAILANEFNKMLDAKEKTDIALKKNIKNLEDYKFALDQSAITAITDKDGVILSVNDNFCKISKYSREELIGKTHRMVSSNFHAKTFFREMWDTILSGKVWIGEIKNKDKEGKFYWIHGTIIPFLDTNSVPFQFLSIRFDITEKKKAEEEMIKAKEQAEKSDRLKSAFLANMSHEIRTPMNGILGFAELLKNPEISGEDQQEYIRIIERSGVRMLNIINDIVDISKIESGLMDVSLSETNINKQIEYIYTFFKPEVNSNGLQLSYTISLPTKESIIKTDREKVYAVLINLVKNAIKYSHKGTIDFGYKLKQSIDKAVPELEFYVKDTGIGIPKDKQKAVFDRFIQVGITDKRVLQGAGLGLSISKAYVEMLGGKIWLESEEGKGSTFYFTIPYITQPEKEIIPKKNNLEVDESNQIKNLKILIVEDDAISKLLITKAVSLFCDTILKASTGIEAVETSLNNPDIDLILIDVNMPEMNGHEATRHIRQFNKDVIIIAQTAYGLANDREEAIAAGCNDYISKPINIDKLKALIQKYFRA